MYRFFSDNLNFHQKEITITDKKEIHHILDVLRFKKGDQIIIFNGNGEEAIGIIGKIESNNIHVSISEINKYKKTKSFRTILCCAIPKKSKFEYIIEKCTELGIDEIMPLITQRTEIRLDQEHASNKLSRYKTIAINAAKQCNRMTIPIIHPVVNFNKVLEQIKKTDIALIPWLEGPRKHILDALTIKHNEFSRILIFIGPEGDFTTDEIAEATKAGCIPVSLGKTTLKVDTAAISVVALINFLFSNQTQPIGIKSFE